MNGPFISFYLPHTDAKYQVPQRLGAQMDQNRSLHDEPVNLLHQRTNQFFLSPGVAKSRLDVFHFLLTQKPSKLGGNSKKMKSFYLSALLLSVWFTSQAQEDLNGIREEFSERIHKTLKKKDIGGATMAVVSSESVLWIENFGFADAAAKQPVTEETLLGLGSVTKYSPPRQ